MELKEAFEVVNQFMEKIAKIVRRVINSVYRFLAKHLGKPGKIYLRTKSRRIREKQRKAMIQKLICMMIDDEDDLMVVQ